jgi:hypothetical protein
MKYPFIFLVIFSMTHSSFGQGSFIADQQYTNTYEGGIGLQFQPSGQSFTPSSSSIDTVFLNLYNGDRNIDASAYLNLRSGSITGTILGTSFIVNLPRYSVGIAEFNFPSPIPLQPGTKYYLQAALLTGGANVIAIESGLGYVGGNSYYGSTSPSPLNLWFQEGITIVPEPSALWLSLAGVGGLVFWRQWGGKKL